MNSTRKSLRTEREFGFLVGGVLILLSAWWLYRGKFTSLAHVALPLGAALVILAALLPRALVLPSKAWMALAEALSFVTTRIVLAFVFFFVVTPNGFIKRLFGWDPLHRRAEPGYSYWQPYSVRQRNPRHYEKMF